MKKITLFALLTLAGVGCGQKGPLYLPPPDPVTPPPAETKKPTPEQSQPQQEPR